MSTFFYFAYGSNMLAQRIHIKNQSAVRIGIGKLNKYRLDFNHFSCTWDGCPSTVVSDVEEHVWGTIWKLNISDIHNLDQQENLYLPFDANIITSEGKNLLCRCYMLIDQPIKQYPLPLDRRPSKSYLQTMILGAIESGIPFGYIKFLKEIPDNGKDGPTMPWTKFQYSNMFEM